HFIAEWLMSNGQIAANQGVGNIDADFGPLFLGPAKWRFQDTGDFNADGKADVLWRHDNDGQVVLWTMNGSQITNNQSVATMGNDWNIQGTGDFNGDGRGDVLLRNDSGQVVIWQMNGAQIVSNTSVATPSNDWHVADVGDYNADGRSDILW